MSRSSNGRYEWHVAPLTEISEIIVHTPGQPDEKKTLGTLIAMTNGDVLDDLPESALALS